MLTVADLDHQRLNTLWSLLDYHATVGPERPATFFEGRTKTYRELRDDALDLAAKMLGKGFSPGDRIGYLGKNSDSYFVLLFAIARIGAVLVPLNWRLAGDELAFIVTDSRMRELFSDEEFLEAAGCLAEKVGIPAQQLVLARAPAAAPAIAAPEPEPAQVVFQVYTSGTTGRPKGAMLTHTSLLALRAPGYREKLEWFPAPEMSVCVVLPVAHIAGTAYALFGFYAGARVVITREFDPEQTLAIIESETINQILLAPAAMQLVMRHPRAAQAEFTSLKYITYGAAPIPEALLREALVLFGCRFVQMYGMTEVAGGAVALRPEDHTCGISDRLRSAGTAMPSVELAVVAEDWTRLSAGSVSEIIIRSPSVMLGYWNRPEATAEVLSPDGWLKTGDIGRMDGDGYVFVLDRAKDMIISGGENVYPAEVENAIFGHPDILDVAVIGAPSEKWGEEVVAIVVPNGIVQPTLESIVEWLEGKIARFKMPKRIAIADKLPRNAGQKVLRRQLREPFWEGHVRRVD